MIALLLLACVGREAPDTDPTNDTEPPDTDADTDVADTDDTDVIEPPSAPCEPGPSDSTELRHVAAACVNGDITLGWGLGIEVSAGNGHVVAHLLGFDRGEGVSDADVAVLLDAEGTTMTSIRGYEGVDGIGHAALIGAEDVWIGAYYAQDGFVYRYALPETPLSEAPDPIGSIEARPVDTGRTRGFFGAALARLDTLDGPMLVVGSPAPDPVEPGPGWVGLFDLDPFTASTDADAATILVGELPFDRTGETLAAGGDLDADGVEDLVVGALDSDHAHPRGGVVWLATGPFPTGDVPLAEGHGILAGEAEEDFAGMSVAFAGDMNEDGYDDVLVGAHWNQTGGVGAGRAYLVYGPAPGERSLSDADAFLSGVELEGMGHEVAGPVDFDGDGHLDLAVAAPGDLRDRSRDVGKVLVVFGPEPTGEIDRSQALTLYGSSIGDLAGAGLAGLPDVDGDGRDELVIGAPFDGGGGGNGRVFIIHGFEPPG